MFIEEYNSKNIFIIYFVNYSIYLKSSDFIMSNEDNQNQLFADWAQKNLSILANLIFYQKDTVSKVSFFQNRIDSHKSTIKKLERFLIEIQNEMKQIQKEISLFQEIADVEYLCYDDMDTILLMRKHAYIQQLICEYSIDIATRKYGYLVDLENNTKIILSLFKDSININEKSSASGYGKASKSKSILPDDQICELNDFTVIDYTQCQISDIEKKLKYLIPFESRISSRIHKKKKALWATNYQQFISKLINEAKGHLISELSYFEPIESEISLSRCLFCYKSPLKSEIDKTIDSFTSIPTKTDSAPSSLITKAAQEFVSELLDQCYKLVGPCYEKMSSTEKSICLLIFFRCLFNRCYEKYGDYFCDFKSNSEKRMKLEKIAKIPAHYFPIPWNLIGNSKPNKKNEISSNSENQINNEPITISEFAATDKCCSIGDLFETIVHFKDAANSLRTSVLQSNPIDALFCIHMALIGINKGAFANFNEQSHLNENTKISNSKNDRNHDDFDMKQLLCFDDMFALMLGTFLGSDKPDIFFVADMIEKFAPKMSLSPSFDFALANIEGLSSHCANFDLEKCYREINKLPNDKI